MFDRSRLTTAREELGINKTELAEKSGLSVSAIHGYETGRRIPNAEQLGALALALDVSSDYLLSLVTKPEDKIFQQLKAAMRETLGASDSG